MRAIPRITDMSPKYKGLFITDLDGTLLTDNKRISIKDSDRLHRLRSENICVAAATGRSLFSFNKLLSSLPEGERKLLADIDYLLFSSGAGILDCNKNELIKTHSLTVTEARYIAKELHELRVDHMVHAPIPHTEYFLFNCYNHDNEDFHHRLSLYREYGTQMTGESWRIMTGRNGVTEVLGVLDKLRSEHLIDTLQEKFSEFSVIRATSPLDHVSTWLEVFAAGVSKSQSADWLCNKLQINREQTCSIGNDYNDEDMLNWSACTYVVANSPPVFKNSYEVVASNNKSGVSEAIDSWMNY